MNMNKIVFHVFTMFKNKKMNLVNFQEKMYFLERLKYAQHKNYLHV